MRSVAYSRHNVQFISVRVCPYRVGWRIIIHLFGPSFRQFQIIFTCPSPLVKYCHV